jgi:hypothetical protein
MSMELYQFWAMERAPQLLDVLCAWAEYDLDRWVRVMCG